MQCRNAGISDVKSLRLSGSNIPILDNSFYYLPFRMLLDMTSLMTSEVPS